MLHTVSIYYFYLLNTKINSKKMKMGILEHFIHLITIN
jgi:hypothetical protein